MPPPWCRRKRRRLAAPDGLRRASRGWGKLWNGCEINRARIAWDWLATRFKVCSPVLISFAMVAKKYSANSAPRESCAACLRAAMTECLENQFFSKIGVLYAAGKKQGRSCSLQSLAVGSLLLDLGNARMLYTFPGPYQGTRCV